MTEVQCQPNDTIATAQEIFWKDLQQFKFDLFYYGNHYQKCIVKVKCVNYILTSLSAIAALIWKFWSNFSAMPRICLIVIIVSQLFTAFSNHFPFNNRKEELRELTNDLDPIYIEMECIWRKIAEGEMTITEINSAIDDFASRRLQIEKNYLKNDCLKEQRKIINKTEKQTQDYFSKFKQGVC